MDALPTRSTEILIVMFLSIRAYDELAEDPNSAAYALWHPGGDEFRGTPQFNAVVRTLGIFEY